jgi:hypothetical protein
VSGGDPALELGRLRAELRRARKTIAELREAMGYQRQEIAALREQNRDPHSIRTDDLPDNAIVCEAHPWLVWPHHPCAGPGIPVEERATLHETAGLIPDADLEAFVRLLFAMWEGDISAAQVAVFALRHYVPEPPLDDRANDASPCLGCRPTLRARPATAWIRLDLLTRRVVGTPSRGDALEGRSGAASSPS